MEQAASACRSGGRSPPGARRRARTCLPRAAARGGALGPHRDQGRFDDAGTTGCGRDGHDRGDAPGRRRDLPGDALRRALARARRFPPESRRRLGPRRLALRGCRHEARPVRQGLRPPPGVRLLGPPRRRAGPPAGAHPRGDRRRRDAHAPARRLRRVLPRREAALRGPRVRRCPAQSSADVPGPRRPLPGLRLVPDVHGPAPRRRSPVDRGRDDPRGHAAAPGRRRSDQTSPRDPPARNADPGPQPAHPRPAAAPGRDPGGRPGPGPIAVRADRATARRAGTRARDPAGTFAARPVLRHRGRSVDRERRARVPARCRRGRRRLAPLPRAVGP